MDSTGVTRVTTCSAWLSTLVVCALLSGCGTTRFSDTQRTATEQLLISDAIDRAVEAISFKHLAGQSVYFDDRHLDGIIDRGYLISSLRQHLLASGCVLKEYRDDADFVVEARAGAVGTDRHDLLFGVPQTNVPQILPLQGMPAAIPEVPIAKRKDQRGIAKIGVFAYHRETGLPVWQSGIARQESSANDVWILGAGPFKHGTIHRGPTLAGTQRTKEEGTPHDVDQKTAGLADAAVFSDPRQLANRTRPLPPVDQRVVLADHQQPQDNAAPPDATPPPPEQKPTTQHKPVVDLSAEIAASADRSAGDAISVSVYEPPRWADPDSVTHQQLETPGRDPIRLPAPIVERPIHHAP